MCSTKSPWGQSSQFWSPPRGGLAQRHFPIPPLPPLPVKHQLVNMPVFLFTVKALLLEICHASQGLRAPRVGRSLGLGFGHPPKPEGLGEKMALGLTSL